MKHRRLLAAFGIGLFLAGAVTGVGLTQPHLARIAHRTLQRDDAFLLPPPRELKLITLGHHAAGADLVWAKILLEAGIHWQEKRPFPDVTRYIDGLLELEPDFTVLFEFLDTILMYPAPPGATAEDAKVTRRFFERGIKARPHDPTMWLRYGQFLAFLAPSFLRDDAEIQRWRTEGAQAIAKAVELGADPDKSLSASTILSKGGSREATIAHLRRAYALTDDVAMREQFAFKLRRLEADAVAEESMATTAIVDREWRTSFFFASRNAALLLGPRRDPAACAGPSSHNSPGCARDWGEAIAQASRRPISP